MLVHRNRNGKLSTLLVRSSIILALFIANLVVIAQTTTGGTIQGIVGSGNYPLPGVEVTATNAETGKKTVTTTGVNGQYQLKVPAAGHYTVEVTLAAFAPSTKEVDVPATGQAARLDFEILLRSRAPQQQAAAAPPPATVPLAGRGARGGTWWRPAKPDVAANSQSADAGEWTAAGRRSDGNSSGPSDSGRGGRCTHGIRRRPWKYRDQSVWR